MPVKVAHKRVPDKPLPIGCPQFICVITQDRIAAQNVINLTDIRHTADIAGIIVFSHILAEFIRYW
jgi:hypothetical protein